MCFLRCWSVVVHYESAAGRVIDSYRTSSGTINSPDPLRYHLVHRSDAVRVFTCPG